MFIQVFGFVIVSEPSPLLLSILTALLGALVLLALYFVQKYQRKPSKKNDLPPEKTDSINEEIGETPDGDAQPTKRRLALVDPQAVAWELDPLPVAIGRDLRNPIVLEDESVSAYQARIYEDEDLQAVCVEDLGSKNGMLVNEQPTRKNILKDGFRIRFGASTCVFYENWKGDLASLNRGTVPQAEDSGTRQLGGSTEQTHPLNHASTFLPRPPGAIFGGRFLLVEQTERSEDLHRYAVSQVRTGGSIRMRACQNEDCGAVFLAAQMLPGDQNFSECPDCGKPLGDEAPALVLIETRKPLFPGVVELTALRLAHRSVRPPLFTFQEVVAGENRVCLVAPKVSAIHTLPDAENILAWGADLARGLDYLHANGIYFDGQVKPQNFAVDRGRAVWADFSNAHLDVENAGRMDSKDVRALNGQLYAWLTGQSEYIYAPGLSAEVNAFFERALSGNGFSSGQEVAQVISLLLHGSILPVDLEFRSGHSTDIGQLRSLNEDSLLVVEMNRVNRSNVKSLGLYAVADGMGGHAAGEVASGIIVETLSRKAGSSLMSGKIENGLDWLEWLRSAVESANQAVYDVRLSSHTDLGSTLVIVLVRSDQAYIANVGDSRAYRINHSGITQLTTDHSLVERLVATRQITRQEARHHPQRNVIYRTVGDRRKVEMDVTNYTLADGDRILLCSDGLSGMLEDNEIQQIVLDAESPQAACKALIDAANAAGGDDNITAILVEAVKV